MLQNSVKKITIVGNAGSGKTTLAFQLHEKYKLPLYHLDQYYWLPNWERIEFDKFSEIHWELYAKNEWIIEGIYIRWLHHRIVHADVIIFLDIPRSKCMWRVIKRAFMNFGKVTLGNPAHCKQQPFSFKFLEFLWWVWNFNKYYRSMIVAFLAQAKQDGKQVYVLKSSKDIADFVLNAK